MRNILATAMIVLMLSAPHAAAASSQTIVIWGTNGADVDGVVGLGVVVCSNAGTGTELECGSDLTGRGQGSFDASGWNSESGVDAVRTVAFDVDMNGLRPPGATGYYVTVCADLDDDLACFDDTDAVERYFVGSSGSGSFSACIPEDAAGGYDEVIVFIGSWVDPTGAAVGASEGAYTVTMTPGAFSSSC